MITALKLVRRASALGSLSLLVSGCAFFKADKIHYTWNPDTIQHCSACNIDPRPAADDTQDDPVIVGLALSGGGARASVFGAAAIEALERANLMDRVDYISSVSGGGFPASYYALKKPKICEDSASSCIQNSFAVFKRTMRQNYLSKMTKRQLTKPGRITSPTRRLSSLQEVLDQAFINGADFSDLPPSPVLLINGARYDDGRRFVFSTKAIPEGDSTIAPFTQKTLRTASFSLPGCTHATPNDFSVALAIAISAGFPPLLGPAAIEAPKECAGEQTQFWHLGDGGILDNSGVETLEDFALRAQLNRPQAIVIFAMDAGRSTSADVMMNTRNLKLWTSDPGRVVDIVGKRANAYRDVVLNDAYKNRGIELFILDMRYTDAQIKQWPPSCGHRENDAAAISAHLAAIPTNFKITDCDADLMELAAHDLIERVLAKHRDELVRTGLVVSE